MPGVTISNDGPQRLRMSGISSGEATTPSRPADCASIARRPTCPASAPATPISPIDSSDRLVSIVTAMTSGRERPAFDASASAASRAAFIIAWPPDACTFTIHTPSRVAAATAPATVLGMSWNFRSRNTRSPRATRLSTMDGPWLVNRRLPILKPPTAPRRRSASACAASAVSTSSATRIWLIHGTHEIRYPRNLMALHVAADAVEHLAPDERVEKVGGADLHGRCAGDHELERVAGIDDAAHADDGNLHGLPALVDHPYGDRPDRRAAQAAHAVRDPRTARFDVEDHRQERVDERHGVGARVFGGARERRDVGDVRRQLRNQREPRDFADGADDVMRAVEVAAELDAAFLDVGARDVQLDGVHARGV